MKNKILLLTATFWAAMALGAGVTEDTYQIGKPSSSASKQIIFGAGTTTKKKLTHSVSGNSLSYDGNSLSVGDGASSNKSILLNNGGTPPTLRWNSSTSTVEWTNTPTWSMTGNSVSIGDGTASNKTLKFNKGASSPEIRYNNTLGKLEFSNDATNYKAIGSGSGAGGGINLIQDANWDFENGATTWSASGGTFTADSSTPLFDLQSGVWDSSAAAQTFSSSLVTIQRGFIGRKCQAEIYYRWPSGVAGDIKFQAVDQVPNVLAEVSLNPTTGSNVSPVFLTFDCPSTATDQLRVRLLSVGSNPAAITVDNAFVGAGRNSLNISQADLYAGVVYNNIANCDVSTTSATVVEAADDADCTSRSSVGEAQFVNNRFKMRVSNLPKGRYELSTMLPIYSDTSGTTCEVYVTASAGSMPATYVQVGFTGVSNDPAGTMTNTVWTQSSDAGQVDFYLNWRRGGGTGACHLATAQAGAATFSMSLKRFPIQTSEAINLETTGWFFDGNIGGANPSLGTGTVSTFTAPNNSTLDLVLNSGSANGRIACASGVASNGLTCATQPEEIGVVVDLPYSGLFETCFDFAHNVTLNGTISSSLSTGFQIMRTADANAGVVEFGKSRVSNSISEGNPQTLASNEVPLRLCGTFNITSAGAHAFRLYYTQAVSGGVSQSVILADRASANGERDIHVTIKPLLQQMPAPVFTEIKKKVESNQAGEKIERARINNNGSACPVVHQSGSWVSGSRTGTGVCALTFTGFSGTPACVVMSAGGAADVANQSAIAPTSTGMTVSTFTSTSGAATDKAFDIICMGPK